MGRQTYVTLSHTGGLCQTSCKATMDHYTSCYTDKSNPDQTIHQLNISLCWLELQFRHRAFGRINPICNFPFIYLWVEQRHLQYTERHIQIFRLLGSKHWPSLSEGEVKEGKHTNRRDRKCEPRHNWLAVSISTKQRKGADKTEHHPRPLWFGTTKPPVLWSTQGGKCRINVGS